MYKINYDLEIYNQNVIQLISNKNISIIYILIITHLFDFQLIGVFLLLVLLFFFIFCIVPDICNWNKLFDFKILFDKFCFPFSNISFYSIIGNKCYLNLKCLLMQMLRLGMIKLTHKLLHFLKKRIWPQCLLILKWPLLMLSLSKSLSVFFNKNYNKDNNEISGFSGIKYCCSER